MSLMCFRISDNEIDILSDSLVSSDLGTVIRGFESKVKILNKCVISGTGDAKYMFNIFKYIDNHDDNSTDNIIDELLHYMNTNKPLCESTIYISGYSYKSDKLIVCKLHIKINDNPEKEIFTNTVLVKPNVIDSVETKEELSAFISGIDSTNNLRKELCQLIGEIIKEKDDINVNSRVGIGGKLELTTITKYNITKEEAGYLNGFGFDFYTKEPITY